MGRYEKNKYIDRVDRYGNLPANAVLVPGESIFETSRGRNKSYAALLQRILAVPGYGELNAGGLTQDFLSTAGICSDKPSRVFGDLQAVTYVGVGAEKGCNWVYRGDRNADPHGTLKEKRNKWHEEILALTWEDAAK